MHPRNRYQTEQEETSTSVKRLKSADDVPRKENISYRILNFVTVFSVMSEYVKCKKCNGDIKFTTEDTDGLGFKVMIVCSSCKPVFIPSCPLIGAAYEINKRFFYALRLLGIGLNGAKKFCGIMDLPRPVAQSAYDAIVGDIHEASATVCQELLQKAVREEAKEVKNNNSTDGTKFTVSGESTWHKRGFTTLFGVSTLIGWYTGKVLDIIVKSAYCKSCESWSTKSDTPEYEKWKIEHYKTCSMNYVGSAERMKVDAIKELFLRSMQRYGIMYTNYIGDDFRTFQEIVNARPYGETIPIHKKECIGHVFYMEKQMGTQLRQCVKKNRGLGGRNKLSVTAIDKLIAYFGLAIRTNRDSKENMKKAIWATYYHYSSTNTKPQHENCPEGFDSWCSWQKAKAENKLKDYKHDYIAYPSEVLSAIKPIYQDLTSDNLLERCVTGFARNNKESLNNLIWKYSPKENYSDLKILEIAANIAASTFNEGTIGLLKVMQVMSINLGENLHRWAAKENRRRLSETERAALNRAKKEKILYEQYEKQKELLTATTSKEETSYDPSKQSIQTAPLSDVLRTPTECPYVPTTSPKHFQDIQILFPELRHPQNIPSTSPKHSQDIPMMSSGRSQEIPATPSGYSQDIPMTSSGHSREIPTPSGHFQEILTTPSGHPQDVPMTSPGYYREIPITSSEHSQEIPITSSGHSQNVRMTSPTHLQDIPMMSPRRTQNVPKTPPKRSQGVPWRFVLSSPE